MPIDGTNLARLRGIKHSSPYPTLFTWELTELATAQVNQAAFAYPLPEVAMDNLNGSWSDVRVGHFYRITDSSGNLITTGVVRKLPTMDTFYMSALYHGDGGIAQRIARPISNNDTITVYDYYPIWSMLSRIANGVFYKRYDVPFTGQTTQPDPICNMGPWRFALVDEDDDEAQFVMSAAGSTGWFGGISAFQWILPDGVTLVSGELTDDTITISCPVSATHHIITCNVTDENSKVTRGIRPVWVKSRYGVLRPFSHLHSVVQNSDRQNRAGRTLSYTIDGALTDDVLHRGAALLQGEFPLYNGAALDPGIGVDNFVGFVNNRTLTGNYKRRTTTIEAVSPFLFSNGAPMVPQALIETEVPARWTDVPTGFGNASFAAWYVLAYHCPNFLLLFDFNPFTDASPPRKRQIALNGTSVGGQLAEAAMFYGGNAGSASDGSVFLRRDPNLEDNDFRNGLDVRCEILPQDILDQIEYPENYQTPTGQVTVYGWVVTDADEVTAWGAISGRAQGQGIDRTSGNTFIVASTDELIQKVGHVKQQMDNPTPEYRIKINRNMDIFDPARHMGAWFDLNIPAQYDPYGVGYKGRAQVKAVDRNWKITDGGTVLKEIIVTFTPETFGQKGELLPREPREVGESIYPEPEEFEESAIASIAIVWGENGYLARSFNIADETANFESIKGSMIGVVSDVVFDRNTQFFLSGLVEGGAGAWAVTTSGTSIRIYYTEDILAEATSITWTLQKTYTATDSTMANLVRLAADNDAAGVCWVGWNTRNGTRVAKTVNGETWDNTPTHLSPPLTDTEGAFDGMPFAFGVEQGRVYVCSLSGALISNPWRFVSAPSTGGSFVSENRMPQSPQPMPQIHFPGDGTAYVSVIEGAVEVTTPSSSLSAVTTFHSFFGSPQQNAGYYVPGHGPITGGRVGQNTPGNVHVFGGITYAFEFDWTVLNFTSVNVVGYALWDNLDIPYIWHLEFYDKDFNLLQEFTGTGTVTPPDVPFPRAAPKIGPGFLPDLNIPNVRYYTVWAETDGKFPFLPPTSPSGPPWGYYLVVGASSGDRMWTGSRVVAPDGLVHIAPFPPADPSDVVDVAPDENFKPRQRNSIATGGGYETLSVLTEDGGAERLYDSVNGGAEYELINSGVTDFRGIRRGGEIVIGWGDDVLAISIDAGATFFDVRGDFEVSVGTLGNVTGVLAIL